MLDVVSIISIVILIGARVVSIISREVLAGFLISIYRGLRLLLRISYLIFVNNLVNRKPTYPPISTPLL